MKKSFFFVPMLAVVILATSCIENNESDSVKQIRLAQAAKLEAEAGAITAAAQADAAVAAAQAALLQAQANYQAAQAAVEEAKAAAQEEETRHQAAMNALQEELAAAQTDAQKAAIEQEMAEAEAQHAITMANLTVQAQIDAADKQKALLEAQLALDAAQKDYDYKVAQNQYDHDQNMAALEQQIKDNEDLATQQALTELLNGYDNAWNNWSAQMKTVKELKSEIAEKTQILNSEDAIADASSVVKAEQQVKTQGDEVTMLETDLANFQAAVSDYEGISQLIADYKAELETLETDKVAQQVIVQQKLEVRNKANDAYNTTYNAAYNEARDAYNEAWDAYNEAQGAYYELDNYINYSAEADTTTAYNNLEDAKIQLASAKTAAEATDATLADKTAYENAKANLTNMQSAYDEAISKYNAALVDWKTAKAAYDEALDAYMAAIDVINDINALEEVAEKYAAWETAYEDYNDADVELYAIEDRINTVNNYIMDLERTEVQIKSEYGTYTTYLGYLDGNIENIEENLEYARVNLEMAEKELEAVQESFDSQEAIERAYLTSYIDALTVKLAAAETKLELYKTALDDWSAQLQAALDEEN